MLNTKTLILWNVFKYICERVLEQRSLSSRISETADQTRPNIIST